MQNGHDLLSSHRARSSVVVRKVSLWPQPKQEDGLSNSLSWLSFALLLLVLLFHTQRGWAAPVTVRATLDESTIYLGESAQLELRISGLREPEPPEIHHPQIDITRAGGQSFSNSSISIINGRTTRIEDFGYVARYLLRPRTAGILKISPISITHDGQTYYSQPVTLVVKQPAQQDHLLVQVYTDKPNYVLGQRITLTLDVSLRKLALDGKELDIDPFFPKQPPHLHVPWFESLGDWKTGNLQTFVEPFLKQQRPGFFINDYFDQSSLFRNDRLTFTLPRHSTNHRRPTGTFNYFTYRLQKTFRPIRTGEQTIPPVLVRATLPIRVDSRGRARQTEKVVATSQSLTVQVYPVPDAGPSTSFSGAVGRFQFDVTATPTVLKVGDPLTVTLIVQREGDSLLETVRPLRLQDQAPLAQDFKIPPDPPAIRTEKDAKRFTYTLRPRHAGVRAVPSIEMTYYDPDTERFRTLRSQPVPLEVEEVSTLAASDIVITSEGRHKSRLGQQLVEGLLANYTGNEVLISQQARLSITPLLGTLLVFPPVAYVLTLLGRQWVRQRRQDPGRQRSRRAARIALASLRRLKSQQNPADATICEGVYRALTGYISDKLDLTGAGLTVDDITHHLRSRQIASAYIDQTEGVFHRCDSIRYAPGPLAVDQLTELIDDAEMLIQQLEASSRL